MPSRCLLYYITDRTAFAKSEDEPTRRARLLQKIVEAARAGVDYIQLREKDLSRRDLESLAREAVRAIQEAAGPHSPRTALLINSHTDVALAAGTDGVHLRSDDISPEEVRRIWHDSSKGCSTLRDFRRVGSSSQDLVPVDPLIAISCHTPQEVAEAARQKASFAIFAPVFEKKDAPGAHATGLDALRQACRAPIPVLALGGVTLANAHACLDAGAAGIAAIRLFQENDIPQIVSGLR